jgi:O-antigen/teichoic acid export membrane protein
MQEAWELLRGLRRTALLASVGYGLLTAGVLLGFFALGWLKATAAVSPLVLAIAAALMLLRPILTYLGAVLRAENPGVIGQLPKFAVQPWAFLILILLIMFAARSTMSAAFAVCAQGIAAVMTVAVAALWLVRNNREPRRVTQTRHEFANWFRSASSFWLLGGMELICTQSDMLVLGTLGTAREAGIYRVAANGANLLLLSAAAVNLYVGPKIPELYARREHVQLQRLLSLIARGAFAASLAVACAFWLWGRELLNSVFGVAYGGAFWPLAILCIGQLIYVASGPSGLLLGMTGHERESAATAGIAAVFNLVLNIMLVPRFGAVGAAVATAIALLIWRLLLARGVKNMLGLRVSIFA